MLPTAILVALLGAAPFAVDAGTSTADAGGSQATERLLSARDSVPLPLFYGAFKPEAGVWVDYDVSGRKVTSKVRAAVVGKVVQDGGPAWQLELDFIDTQPHLIVVLWISEGATQQVLRLALSVGEQPPIAVPTDLPLTQADLRGTVELRRGVPIKSGPFAGKASQEQIKTPDGHRVELTLSQRVPLFGVESARDDKSGESWVARGTGTGAKPGMTVKPLNLPR